MFHSFDEYAKGKDHFEKAIAINKEIGHRRGEASCYGN